MSVEQEYAKPVCLKSTEPMAERGWRCPPVCTKPNLLVQAEPTHDGLTLWIDVPDRWRIPSYRLPSAPRIS